MPKLTRFFHASVPLRPLYELLPCPLTNVTWRCPKAGDPLDFEDRLSIHLLRSIYAIIQTAFRFAAYSVTSASCAPCYTCALMTVALDPPPSGGVANSRITSQGSSEPLRVTQCSTHFVDICDRLPPGGAPVVNGRHRFQKTLLRQQLSAG